ncbi:MAG: CoA ester lyase [Hyphomonadaceae bacterium]|nr:CoA ester lyase [Hyphomonadaceae bacterium]MBC6411754.1 CoA ester lyase [Hyphomonadaceae bacterium]
MTARSLLFVPGNRPDRFEKACNSDADLVCIDLEDAVGPADKDRARDLTLEFLAGTASGHVGLRINPADSPFYEADIKALKNSRLNLPFIMLPKVGNLDEVNAVDRALPDGPGPFFTLIESAKGLVNCEDILSHPRITCALYGAIDYAGDVGCDGEWETHLYARSRMVAACVANNVLMFDVPYLDVRDPDGCEAATRRSKSLGIFARAAIHPGQIAPIHKALAPSEGDIAHARRVMAAFEQSTGNVALLDGRLLEAPIVKAAQRILSQT